MTRDEIEQHRHQEEVEYVASKPDSWIKSFLEGVKQKRGEKAWAKLIDGVEKERRRLRK